VFDTVKAESCHLDFTTQSTFHSALNYRDRCNVNGLLYPNCGIISELSSPWAHLSLRSSPPMPTSLSAIPDRPRVTVAAIAERDGRFLFVEERDAHGSLVINQPAGHLEVGESLTEGVIREALEETAWRVEPESLVGVYVWGKADQSVTYLRVAIAVSVIEEFPERPLDEGIERALWLSREELIERSHQHRSPLVLQCVDDYLHGSRHPLSILKHSFP
jgi:ADP-ribose pyrophosphatase YjhB (NUDIX family)